jgi:hypothetical protein
VSLSAIPWVVRDFVADRDGGRCGYCSLHQYGQGAVFHINHIVPRSRGGKTVIENLVLQCPCCSLRKANKIDAIDPSTNETCPIFQPLLQRWDDHFVLESDGLCRGLTPSGRATVMALGMNDPIPKTARAVQILIGIL